MLVVEKENKVSENLQKIIQRNLMLYVFGRLVSILGSEIFTFAMGLYILKTTGSGLAFSMVLLTKMLPKAILSSFVGVIVDKLDRKKIIVLTDILAGFVMLALYFVSAQNGLKISMIYVSTLLLSCLSIFFSISMRASKANIVNKDNLVKLNSFDHSMSSIAQISGPMLGGLIFLLVDIRLFVLLNGISFILSGISELFIKFNIEKRDSLKTKSNKSRANLRSKSILMDIKEGYNYLKTTKIIYILTIYGIALDLIMICGVAITVPYIANNVLGLSPKAYGLIQMSFPIGILAASLLLSIKSRNNYSLALKIKVSMYVIAIGVLVIGIVSSPIMNFNNKLFYIIVFVLYGSLSSFFTVVMDVPIQVIFQEEISDEFRGRVMGLQSTISLSITPLGMIIAGILIDVFPAYILPLVSGILLIFITTLLCKNKEFSSI